MTLIGNIFRKNGFKLNYIEKYFCKKIINKKIEIIILKIEKWIGRWKFQNRNPTTQLILGSMPEWLFLARTNLAQQ